jgi:hypothetical protein
VAVSFQCLDQTVAFPSGDEERGREEQASRLMGLTVLPLAALWTTPTQQEEDKEEKESGAAVVRSRQLANTGATSTCKDSVSFHVYYSIFYLPCVVVGK